MKPDKIRKIYEEEFINYNLRNIIESGCVDYGFIPVKDIKLMPDLRIGKPCVDKNPYLYEDNAVENLANSIFEKGTYWMIVLKDGYLFEGTHRVISLKLGIKKGHIPEDFCLFYIDASRELMKPIDVYMRDDFFVEGLEYLPDLLSKKEESSDDPHLYTGEITKREDCVTLLNHYAISLKDLIYPYGCEIIPPSRVINDEEYFYEWLEK